MTIAPPKLWILGRSHEPHLTLPMASANPYSVTRCPMKWGKSETKERLEGEVSDMTFSGDKSRNGEAKPCSPSETGRAVVINELR